MLGRGQQKCTYILHNGRAQSCKGKALCKGNADCGKAIIVTVCNNTEVINQLLSAVHSRTLIEEQVNGRIQQSVPLCFPFSNTSLLCPVCSYSGEVCLVFLCPCFCAPLKKKPVPSGLPPSKLPLFSPLHHFQLGCRQLCGLGFIISTSLPH